MSFFTNPFAPSTPPLFAAPTLNPLPAPNSFPLPATLRRSSLVRAATPFSGDPVSPSASPSGSPGSVGSASGGSAGAGGITFVSPFTTAGKRSSVSHSAIAVASQRKSAGGSGSPARSTSRARSASSESVPGSRRASLQGAPSPLSPAAASTAHASPFFSGYLNPNTAVTSVNPLLKNSVDFSRRRSVDVGVLGVGTHRVHGVTAVSKRVRDAVGPDAGDKETGVIGAGAKGGKDRLLGRHLASLLAHSLALCAEPKAAEVPPGHIEEPPTLTPHQLDAIPASPSTSPSVSRHTSISVDSATGSGSTSPTTRFNCSVPPSATAESMPILPAHSPAPAFPVLFEDKRFKLISNLQSWSFNAMSYTSDELLACVGIIFESVRNMEGVEFDFTRFKALLLSLRSAYHARNGYHNFSHAADVTQACYSFLVRMGLAPPLYLLCEDDYDANLGQARRKWRRNRAVEEGGMGELLRPMDVFALMVACIGHDVGHPGLTNAYMVNARAPVAQVYQDKSILENFHTVTLIHMLRKHQFEYLLGGDFGRLGDQATSFRKIVEASILATDMSRHFAFVTQLSDMGRRFSERKASKDIEADRLLLCSGLIKCADISNPTRPHRVSSAWSTALMREWAVQASIESEFGLPITVMRQDPTDSKALAKGQVGFIDLFCKPLFAAMAGCVDEFHDFVEKLRDGRTAWDSISLQTDEAFSKPIPKEWKLSPAPPSRRVASSSSSRASESEGVSSTDGPITPRPSKNDDTPVATPPIAIAHLPTPTKPVPVPSEPTRRSQPTPLRTISQRHRRNGSNGSYASTNPSPLSPSFIDSASSAGTGISSFSQLSALSLNNGAALVGSAFSPRYGATESFLSTSAGLSSSYLGKSACGGKCHAATAMCEVCAAQQRRGSLGNVLAGLEREQELSEDEELDPLEEEDADVWPPHPFQPTRTPA
ncbi:hypothetical protein JCM21900_001026 [Sporobolomyces salmonicolor]